MLCCQKLSVSCGSHRDAPKGLSQHIGQCVVDCRSNVGSQEGQEFPLPFTVNCPVSSGCFVEPKLGKQK